MDRIKVEQDVELLNDYRIHWSIVSPDKTVYQVLAELDIPVLEV